MPIIRQRVSNYTLTNYYNYIIITYKLLHKILLTGATLPGGRLQRDSHHNVLLSNDYENSTVTLVNSQARTWHRQFSDTIVFYSNYTLTKGNIISMEKTTLG